MTRADKIHSACIIGIAVAASFGLALLGEPQAVWFWRDLLGVLP